MLGATAAALILAVIGAITLRRRPAPVEPASPIDSLAVLPLANFSGDPAQEYFADGMTDALIGELAKIRALKVISRTSVMQYKETKLALPDIAGQLGVRGVIEGSVARDAGSVRISVQLIDAAQDRHVWAESYTREARDVLRLQSDVAQAIARAVRVAVTPEEHDRLAAASTVDPAAHELLLQAVALQGRADSQRGAIDQVVDLYRRAVELAPDFASAHAALAAALFTRAGNGYQAMSEACGASRAQLERAFALEPSNIQALAISATLRGSCDFDWEGAGRDFARALEQAPGSSEVLANYSTHLASIGRFDESIAAARRAEELDPLNEWLRGWTASRYYEARRFDQAAAHLDRMLELSPDSIFAKWIYGEVRTAQGRYDEAIALLVSRKLTPPARPEMNFVVGLAHGLAGRKAEARKVLDFLLEKRRDGFVPPSQIAVIYGALGERDEGLRWLERSYEERAMFIELLAVDPIFDPLRDDGRFDALLAKMNLPRIVR